MEEIWWRIENWLGFNAPKILQTLQPGASEAQIKELEQFLGIRFPNDFKSSYRIHNGQSNIDCGLVDGYSLLSLDGIQREWSSWKEVLDDGTFLDEEGHDYGSDPDPGVRDVWYSDKWIPITYFCSGDCDCLDLDPTEEGQEGQIIRMIHDDWERKILATSFQNWLQKYAEGLESGEFIVSNSLTSIYKRK